jgi:subtilisin family serine protease
VRKRRLLLPLAALAGALLLVVPGAIAGGGGDGTLESPTGAWFIQLSGSPETFAAKAKAARLEYTERYRFNNLWKGVSVEASPETVQDLKTLAGVEAVFPVLEARLDPTETVSPELATAINMTGANEAQSELGLTGKGVKVAVMDTGVDYDNPDLGSCFGAGCRVATGVDLVGDRFDASASGGALRPHPDADPDDCNGHGTHVAGIIGAKAAGPGGVTGVAPGVTFGVYRVFGCEGSTTADIMLAAMERIAADDMDVLNMSIGSAFQTWPQYPTAVGADKLVSEHGVVVVASIGNSGANGVYSAGAPGVGRNVIGVASIDNTHVNALTFRTSRTNRQVPYMQIADTKEAPTSGSTPELVHVGRGCSTTSPPDPYLANPAGKVALIDRGTCTFNEKYQRAIGAGAVAVVVANNVSGLFAGGGVIDRGFPAVGISKEDGDAIKAELAGGAVTLTWTGDRINAVNPTGGLASSFTSYGLTAELDLKPDIAAPGGLIFSTYPLEKGGHTVLSGTSMASPHVAGAVALFLEARPGTTPAMVRQILQNSADPIPLAPGVPQAVHRVGAGMLDIDDAIESTTSIAPGKVVLGEGSTAKTVQLTIANNGPAAVTYSVGHEPAAGTRGSTFAPILTGNFASASFSPSSVLVPAGGSATVDVTITPNTSDPRFDRSVYGGYIRVTGGGKTFRVPYAGFTGDYQSIQVLAPGGCSFPGIFKRGGSTECVAATPTAAAQMLEGFTRQAAGATYNVEQREDRPVILFHLAHQSRRLEIRAVNASGQEFLVGRSDFVIRNPTNDRASTGFFTFTWDGKALFANAKNEVSNRRALDSGQYKLKVVVTKAQQVGDASPETLEVWDSPMLNIVRIG